MFGQARHYKVWPPWILPSYVANVVTEGGGTPLVPISVWRLYGAVWRLYGAVWRLYGVVWRLCGAVWRLLYGGCMALYGGCVALVLG